MTVYKVNIDQPLTRWNRFTRFIEADTLAQATEIAATLIIDDDDEPEDAYDGLFDEEAGAWDVNDIEVATEKDLAEAEDLQLHNITESQDASED